MAAVTNNGELTYLRTPGMRCWSVTASDAETFTPDNINAKYAFAVYAADPATGNPIGCTVSSGVVTINCTSMSDVNLLLFVLGED